MDKNNNFIINITTPIPILQQNTSSINTNPFLMDNNKINIIKSDSQTENDIENENQKEREKENIYMTNLDIEYFFKDFSINIIDFLNDLLDKPNDDSWISYLVYILYKNNRYTYIGILSIIIALMIYIIEYM